VLADVRDVDLSSYDAVFASPPCQSRSSANTVGNVASPFGEDLLAWSLALTTPILWVENIYAQAKAKNTWGTAWNAAQFTPDPVQNRNRVIGGRYLQPTVYRAWAKAFEGICPAIMATEYKGCATDKRRASRFYGRKLTLNEVAYHQGFTVPMGWYDVPEMVNPKDKHGKLFTPATWMHNLYEAIGNGVPVFMAQAFGEAYTREQSTLVQMSMFADVSEKRFADALAGAVTLLSLPGIYIVKAREHAA
jgi:site-specific DNA-cytosine methylase